MELTWQNDRVVGGSGHNTVIPDEERVSREVIQTGEEQRYFIHEDENEMASWLHYSLDESFDRESYADLMCSAPPPPTNSGISVSPLEPNNPHSSRFLTDQPVITVMERERTLKSSPGCSSASLVPTNTPPHEAENHARREKERKRKATAHDNRKGCQKEDMRTKAAEDKRQSHGPIPTKRSRVAQIQNISEKRRRDRINVRISALQELIPGCKKSDKASILQAAIDYLKLLQRQIQMMSMSCGMIPMMYPGMQQYLYSATGVGLTWPIVPYPTIQTGSATRNLESADNPSQAEIPDFVSAYQQFLGPQQKLIWAPQNQELVQPNGNRPSIRKDINNPESR